LNIVCVQQWVGLSYIADDIDDMTAAV
jgi:hypothetical protein